jgi:hypothetical protein
MLLDEIKSLIKECEECLIKDTRFKKDYQFKSQVRAIYKHDKNIQTRQIIVPVPYYSNSYDKGIKNSENDPKKCGVCKKCLKKEKCEKYDEADLNIFKEEADILHQVGKDVPRLKDAYSEKQMKEIYDLNLSLENLNKLFEILAIPENEGKFNEVIVNFKK